MRDWSSPAKTISLSALILYIPLIATLLTRSAYRDDQFSVREQIARTGFSVRNVSGWDMGFFTAVFITYFVRISIFLVLFALISYERKYRMAKTVFFLCLIPEILLILSSFSSYSGASSGPFGSYGWGILFFSLGIALSSVLQIIAMLFGWLLPVKKASGKNSS